MKIETPLRWLTTLAVCLACSVAMIAATGQTAPAATGPDSKHSARPELTGEKIFQQNCARCHNPPMTLSQRVTGTVIQHMRVRARLSSKEQALLLKYLAP